MGLRAGADVAAGMAPNWKELPLVAGVGAGAETAGALGTGAALQLPNSDLAGVCKAGSEVAVVTVGWPKIEPLSDEAGAAGAAVWGWPNALPPVELGKMGLNVGWADVLTEVLLVAAAPVATPKIGFKAEARGLTVALDVSVAAAVAEEAEGGFTRLVRLNAEGCTGADDCATWGKTWLKAEVDTELGSWMVGATVEDD